MLNFDFTEEQEMMRQSIRRFWGKEMSHDYAGEIDKKEEFPQELWQKMADLGWTGFPFPEEYGGGGGGVVDQTLLIHEIARGLFVAGFRMLLTTCFGGNTLKVFGTDEQKEKYLAGITRGEYKWALALTEPGGGTDILGSTITRAESEGNHWVVNGQKTFISGADDAAYFTLFARTNKDPEKKTKAFSMFVVDAESPGVTVRKIPKLGLKACPACDIYFDNVHVPNENLLGEVDNGWYQLTDTLNNERITVAAFCVGLAESALEYTIKYAKERPAFGRPIANFQTLQNYITDVYVELELAKLMLYKAAWLQSQGRPVSVEGTMAKMVCSEVGHHATVVGMRVMAGAGYTLEHPMERYFRDAVLFLFAPVTNESGKNFLAKNLGLGRAF